MAQMDHIRGIMEDAIKTGLGGTSYEDRILPSQSPNFQIAEKEGRLIQAEIPNAIIRSVTAIMEVKSSMGVIWLRLPQALAERCLAQFLPLPMLLENQTKKNVEHSYSPD